MVQTLFIDGKWEREIVLGKEAVEYLKAALDEGEPVFLLALRQVAQAFGMSKIAARTKLTSRQIYALLHGEPANRHPALTELAAILKAMGLRLVIEERKERRSKKKIA